MAKCGACGKFFQAAEGAKCTKCTQPFHRACVAIPASASISTTWLCPVCKAKVPREDNSLTPVKGIAATYSMDQPQEPVTAITVSSCTGPGISTQGSAQGAARDNSQTTTQVKDSLALEIRAFREELGAVRSEIREMRLEWAGSIKSCNDRIEAMEGRLLSLEQSFAEKIPPNVDALEDTISVLREELNTRDQELLLNDVDIAGVPENPDDNLVHLVKVLALKVGTEILDSDIVHVERVGPINRNARDRDSTGAVVVPPRPRNIVVRLARRITRDQLIAAARVRRTITSTELELRGAPRRIYVNERLTRTNRRLFARAREAARRAHYKYTWTREGKIFVRKEDGRMAERVRCDKDLAKIFGTSGV